MAQPTTPFSKKTPVLNTKDDVDLRPENLVMIDTITQLEEHADATKIRRFLEQLTFAASLAKWNVSTTVAVASLRISQEHRHLLYSIPDPAPKATTDLIQWLQDQLIKVKYPTDAELERFRMKKGESVFDFCSRCRSKLHQISSKSILSDRDSQSNGRITYGNLAPRLRPWISSTQFWRKLSACARRTSVPKKERKETKRRIITRRRSLITPATTVKLPVSAVAELDTWSKTADLLPAHHPLRNTKRHILRLLLRLQHHSFKLRVLELRNDLRHHLIRNPMSRPRLIAHPIRATLLQSPLLQRAKLILL